MVRVFAVLLSLCAPGVGHVLIGAFRRGLAWAIGLPLLGLVVLFAVPMSLVAFAAALVILVGAYVGAAVDVARRPISRPSWKRLPLALGGLLLAGLVLNAFVTQPVVTYYRTHYVQAFTIPSGSMMPALLVGDYILTDKAVYRSRRPQRGDIVVFKYPVDERRDFIQHIVGLPGEQIQIRGRQVLVNGAPLAEPDLRFSEPASALPGGETLCGYAYGLYADRPAPRRVLRHRGQP
jgi:signal peptidase I